WRETGRDARTRPGARRPDPRHPATGVPGRGVRHAVRADHRRARGVDRPQDIAQPGAARVRRPGVSRPGFAWREHLATAALLLLGLALYARGLGLGFVGDDFALLDAARRIPVGELL